MKPLIALAAAGALAACSTVRSESAPSCRGPLRPANPYGSVLSDPTPVTSLPTPAPASATSVQAPCGGDRP